MTIVDQGNSAITSALQTATRERLKTLVSHVGVSTASDPVMPSQTVIDPTPGTNLVKASIETDIDATTFDATMTIDGSVEFTGQVIRTVAVLNGAVRTAILSRDVLAQGIGIIAGDVLTVGVRVAAS